MNEKHNIALSKSQFAVDASEILITEWKNQLTKHQRNCSEDSDKCIEHQQIINGIMKDIAKDNTHLTKTLALMHEIENAQINSEKASGLVDAMDRIADKLGAAYDAGIEIDLED